MKAMVLTAGEGTRLRPLTDRRPKPILPLAGRPLLDYTLDLLALHGVDEAILNLHHAADTFEAALRAETHPRVRTHVSREVELLGTAGAVRRVADRLDDTFFLLYGDNLADVDLGDLLRFHRERGALATLGLFPVPDPSGVGVVDVSADGSVRGFHEKPTLQETTALGLEPPFAANAGIYVLEPEVIAAIPENGASDWGRDIFPALLAAGATLMARFVQGHLRDTGTPTGYLRAHRDLLAGRLPRLWRPGARGYAPVTEQAWAHVSSWIDTAECVAGPAVIGPRSVVARDARIGAGSAVGADVRLAPGVRLHGAVLWDGCQVESGAVVDRAIVGAGCRLEAGCHLQSGVIIGDNSVIRAGAVVTAGTRVPAGANWP